MLNKVRVRFSPSPTGMLHVGNARTALFNFLFARKEKAVFVLRIEDTDKDRVKKEYEDDIFESLKWLGIDCDEGPDIGGAYAPYKQSERGKTYKEYLQKLLEQGSAFYCFHSEDELEKEKEKQYKSKQAPLHICEFRKWDREEVEKTLRQARGKGNYVIRFKMPEKIFTFSDIIRGEVSFDGKLIGDFSIARNLDEPLYNFAVVVDDELMKITHIIRGEDHISNTPKQLALIEALGFKIPQYAHLPLILGKDRTKLSKRHGAITVSDYKKIGYLPETMINFLALLGWNPDTEKELWSREELIENFSLEKVQKSAAVFNKEKLNWMNKKYIKKKGLKELAELSTPFYEKEHIRVGERSFLEKIIELERERIEKLSDLPKLTKFFFVEKLDYPKEFLMWKNSDFETIKQNLIELKELFSNLLTFDVKSIKEKIMPLADKKGRGEVLWPLRVALTGEKASAGPFEIAGILGKEKTIKRIDEAIAKI